MSSGGKTAATTHAGKRRPASVAAPRRRVEPSGAPFQLVLLGRFSLTGPQGPVDLGSKKLCALLAFLACAVPESPSRETLTTLLWGSHFEAQARQNLRQALSRLRRALGDDVLASDDDAIRVKPGMIRCDAESFEQLIRGGSREALAAAADLYQGTFLANIAIPEEAWADWVNSQRHRLENLAVTALIRLGEEEEKLANPARALELANRAVAIDGLREDGHRLLMRALAMIGRRAEAFKHYDELAARLKRELSVEPDTATAALIAELRKPRPPKPASGTAPAAQSSTPPDTPSPVAPAPRISETTDAGPPAAPPSSSAPASAHPVAERRQVSVLFCDLVGSTALSDQLDPEEFAAVIARYQQATRDVVSDLGGHIAKLLGDGIMAYFGWPVAHEDDAERALRAGLRLIGTIATVPAATDQKLLARIGVATGLVVIGGSHADSGDGGIAGLTPNIAARLQAEAETNTLVVTPMTAGLAGKAFEYRSLGQRSIKGLAEPVEVLQVVGLATGRSRFEAQRARSDAPLIGRAEELDLLLSRYRRAGDGEGQVVLLSGDAGIGKSRLVHATSQRIKPDALVMRVQCSPLHQDIALFPIIQYVQRTFGITSDDSVEDKLSRLETILRRAGVDPAEHLPFLCHLLQIDSKAHKLPDFTLRQFREHVVAALRAHVRGLGKAGPILAIVEDAQWIDPTTEDLVLRVLGGLEHLPMMIIVTSRDPFPRRWQVHGYTTTLSLDRLAAADSRRLIHAIAGDHLPEDTQGKIAARAEGVPLYLEELTLSLIEPGRNGRPADRPDVPVNLHALLATRLDQMGEAKRLVQVGAVLGRQFTPADLREVSGCSEAELAAMLDQSLASGLLHQHGSGNDTPLVFKHALVQDAAYASLLNSEKKRLHALALHYLEARAASAPGGDAAALAVHAERGEVWDKAARHLITSCTHAIRGSANREAIVLFDRALRALDRLPADAAAPLAIDVRLHAFSALLALGEIDRLVQVLREAEALARGLGDRRRLAAATSQLANALWLAGEHAAGLQIIEEAERLASELGDLVPRLSSRFNHANLLHATGKIRQAADMYAAMLEDLAGELEFKRFGWPGIPSVLARCLRAWSLIWLGAFADARRTIERAHEVVRHTPQPYSIVYAHLARGLYHEALGDVEAAIVAFEAAHSVNQQVEMVLPIGGAWLAAAYARGGRPREALPLLLDAERNGTYRSGGKYNWVHHHIAFAQTHLGLRDLPAARVAIKKAQDICEGTGELAHLAWTLKLRGDIEAADPATAAAASDAYRRALALAEQCGLRPLVAHCLAGLADHGAADALFKELGIRRT